ncbi:MAG: histidine phosphatase family protein [Propioniciclava sp.]
MLQPHAITFVRHGQCVGNAQGRVVGHWDSPLTPLGHTQAATAASLLAAEPRPVALVSSDLQRARVTAEIIQDALAVPLFLDAGLREQFFGDMEGQLFSELTSSSAGGTGHINEIRWGNGESVADLYGRLAETLPRLMQAHPGRLVLVTHGHVIQVAMAMLRGKGPRDVDWFELPNGGIVHAPPQARPAGDAAPSS